MNDAASPFIHGYGFKEHEQEFSTAPHAYARIIVPANGIDASFNRKVADIFKLSYQHEGHRNLLNQFIAQSYAQMGSIYDYNFVTFMHTLQGSMVEAGNVPGYPQHDGLDIFDMSAEDWSLFVMEFRNTAMQFWKQIDVYAAHFRSMNVELFYNSYIPGAWVFYASPRKYEIL